MNNRELNEDVAKNTVDPIEMMTQIENVELMEPSVNELNEMSRLKIIEQNSLLFEWLSKGRNRSLVVSANYRLTTGVWHSVMVEANYVEVVLMLDMVTRGEIFSD